MVTHNYLYLTTHPLMSFGLFTGNKTLRIKLLVRLIMILTLKQKIFSKNNHIPLMKLFFFLY